MQEKEKWDMIDQVLDHVGDNKKRINLNFGQECKFQIYHMDSQQPLENVYFVFEDFEYAKQMKEMKEDMLDLLPLTPEAYDQILDYASHKYESSQEEDFQEQDLSTFIYGFYYGYLFGCDPENQKRPICYETLLVEYQDILAALKEANRHLSSLEQEYLADGVNDGIHFAHQEEIEQNPDPFLQAFLTDYKGLELLNMQRKAHLYYEKFFLRCPLCNHLSIPFETLLINCLPNALAYNDDRDSDLYLACCNYLAFRIDFMQNVILTDAKLKKLYASFLHSPFFLPEYQEDTTWLFNQMEVIYSFIALIYETLQLEKEKKQRYIIY